MNKNYCTAIIFIVFAAAVSAFPRLAFAQSISLTSVKTSYGINEDISVALVLDTANNPINTVQATIQVPMDFFEISGITTGSSFLSFWPERPTAHDDGTVTFTGGIPTPGFTGPNGNILAISLKAKKSGQALIAVESATVLLNDGLGTELKDVKLMPLKLNISPQIKKEAAKPPVDNVPPEPFTPVISQVPSIANNSYFVSFSAKDLGSGISHYEVREGYVILPVFAPLFLTDWQKAETPHVLGLQHWWSRVYVRAYDNAGNYRDEAVAKPLDKEGAVILYVLIAIIAAIILLFIFKLIFKRSHKK